MQKNATLIHDLTFEELITLFKGLENKLNELQKNMQPIQPPEYYTRAEVAQLLKCDLSTIHNWVKKGKLTPYGIGNRVYFKRSEIEGQIIPIGRDKFDSS